MRNDTAHADKPVRERMLPYGRQWIDEDDIEAVVDVLRSDWLTTGPKVAEFEAAFAEFVGTREAVAVSNGTAALHAAMHAAGVGDGDEVIVTPMTFAASANCVVYCGGKPVFADVEPDTLLIDPEVVEAKITPATKAVVAVDYAGQPCDYDALRSIADTHNLLLIDDACHAVGGSYKGRSVGSLADLNTFSLHPVKHFTTGEGGLITTDDIDWARKMRTFRNHGITTDHRQRDEMGSWYYEMVSLGYNYRLTDFQCALGISQLKKLPEWMKKRQKIAALYNEAFHDSTLVRPLRVRDDIVHGYHLYMVRINLEALTIDRDVIFGELRDEGIGVNVHYIPVHLHPFYQRAFGTSIGDCPIAESAYNRLLTLPIFPQMTGDDVQDVVVAVEKVLGRHLR